MNIYVNFDIPKYPSDFIKKLFIIHNERDFYKERLFSIETYLDKNYKKLQCEKGKYRTFTDVYNIVKTYYPNINKKRLLIILINTFIVINGETHYFSCYRCNTIKNYTMCYNIYISCGIFDNHHNRKNNWESLFKLLDIKNSDELKEILREKRDENEKKNKKI